MLKIFDKIDRRFLNFCVIAVVSLVTFFWTFFSFHKPFIWVLVLVVIALRMLASFFIFRDYASSWRRSTQVTYLLKSFVYTAAFVVSLPLFYGRIEVALLVSELLSFIFCINFLVAMYSYIMNKTRQPKTKSVVIYGAGKAGTKLREELVNSEYKVEYFIDDASYLHDRNIDTVRILSREEFKKRARDEPKFDLLLIAIPSASRAQLNSIYEEVGRFFNEIKILPPIGHIVETSGFSGQLRDIQIEDLLARDPKDLDKHVIERFVKDRRVMITGGGGSIGSELVRQCVKNGAKSVVVVDHSEYNLYRISEEFPDDSVRKVLASVTNDRDLEDLFRETMPEIVFHAAAYKHVRFCELNPHAAVYNNVVGTKNCIDLAIKYGVRKFVLISTDKAVRPTSVMGSTKRVCELYAQNVDPGESEIVAVRFGNVLGSSGSVVPKFRKLIKENKPLPVTHPEVKRYFMLISEACQLVLQAASLGKGGEIFILDMGEPVKIVDLARKMLRLAGKSEDQIVFTGLDEGEKLYEELLLDDKAKDTKYPSIFVAKKTPRDLGKLKKEIDELVTLKEKSQIVEKLGMLIEHL